MTNNWEAKKRRFGLASYKNQEMIKMDMENSGMENDKQLGSHYREENHAPDTMDHYPLTLSHSARFEI